MTYNKDVEEALSAFDVRDENDVHRSEEMTGFDLPDMSVSVSTEGPSLVEDAKTVAIKMAFVGLGQGGGNMADTFWRYGYRRVLIMNTTEQDFRSIECPHRVVIGDDARGAGKDPVFGAKVFDSGKEDVLSNMKRVFGKDVEQVMLCVGSGGGTGGGSLLGALKIAREFVKSNGTKDAKVGVIMSLPSPSEGSVVINNSDALLASLLEIAEKESVTPIVVADNAKILKIFPNTKVGQRWEVVNKSVCGLFDSFNVLAAQSSSHATFDPQDYKRVLHSGVMIFGRSALPASNNGTELSDAIRKNLKGGFLSDRFSIATATHAACIIVAKGSVLNDLQQDAYDAGFDTLQRVIGSKDVVMYQGIFENERIDGIQLFTIAGGLK